MSKSLGGHSRSNKVNHENWHKSYYVDLFYLLTIEKQVIAKAGETSGSRTALFLIPRTWTRLRSLTFIRLHLSIKHVFYLLCVLWIFLKTVINAVLALVYIECLKHEDFNFHFSWLHVPHRGWVHLRRSFIIKEVLGPRLVLGHPSPRSLQGLSLSSDTKSSSSPHPRTPKSSSSPRPRT